MTWLEEFAGAVPGPSPDGIDWDRIGSLLRASCFSELDAVPQNPVYHGEGDAGTHTRMVCRELVRAGGFDALAAGQKTALLLAALLHDIGKVRTTREERGAVVSPHHASTGARLAREFLWRECGLCGDPEALAFRENVCALVRYHMLPVRLLEQEDPDRKARLVSAAGRLAGGFSWSLLTRLAEADVRGRLADDTEECLNQVRLAGMLAQEAGCLSGPYPFPDGFTARAYLSGRNVPPDQPLYDDTWGEVVLLSGLPGTGKDTWISAFRPDLPVVSLDDIRKRNRISPDDSQGAVVQLAREQAREYLRKKQPFIWNATDLTRETRQKLVSLFENYGAAVRIVYLETSWENRAARNAGRREAVPESAVSRMLGRTVPPLPDEARTVEWICV